MALDKDILGDALYNARQAFNNTPWAELVQTYGDEEGIRRAIANEDARVIVEHIKQYGVVPALGLVAPSGGGPVTGEALIN